MKLLKNVNLITYILPVGDKDKEFLLFLSISLQQKKLWSISLVNKPN